MKSSPSATLRGFLVFCTVLPLLGAGAGDPPHTSESSVKHVEAKQAHELITGKKVIVLDLRTPAEFKTGRIAGAKNIDFRAPDFEQRIKQLDKAKAYLVHCASGGRSSQALSTFTHQQFQSIYHLDGGIKAWEKAGLPLEK